MNTNKQYKYINIKLYKEFFRQLSIISIICLSILMMFTFLIPVKGVFEITAVNYSKSVVDIIDSFLHFILIFTVYVPLLTLYAFHFLTKRNACDYYHSFPHTRTCLYLTIIASIVSWTLIVLFANTFISIIIYTILSKYYVLNIGGLVLFSLSIMICSLLVAASVALACTISGTTFTNVAVSGIIIFFPRILITVLCGIITSAHSVFVTDKLFPLFYSDMNIVFDTVYSAFVLEGAPSFFEVGPLIYTMLLAVIYFIAAGALFARRKSETAGNPAANQKTQGIIRIVVALPVTLFAIPTIFHAILGISDIGAEDVFRLFIIYVVAITIMLVYEFIANRKIRNIAGSVPSVGILFLTNILIIAGLYIIDTVQLNYTPSSESIDYITLPQGSTMDSDMTYFDQILGKYKIKDPSMIEFVSEKLEDTVKNCKNVNGNDWDYYYPITVGINSGIYTKYRNIYMPEREFTEFYEDLLMIDEIKQIFVNIPEYNKYSSYIRMPASIDEKTQEQLYNIFKDEIKSVDPASWAKYVTQQYSPIALSLVTVDNDYSTYTNTYIPLSPLTPDTLQKYINIINSSLPDKTAEKISRIIDSSTDGYDNDATYYIIDINQLSDDLLSYDAYCTIYSDEESVEIENVDKKIVDNDYYDDYYDDYENDEDENENENENDDIVTIVEIDNKKEILNFVKDCFANTASIEDVFREGYSLVSIEISAYDDISYDDYDDYPDSMIEEKIYVLVERDKIIQYLSAHKAEDDEDFF